MGTQTSSNESDLAGHVHINVETIGVLVSEAEQKITRHQRAVEGVTGIIGKPRTLYAVIAAVFAWVLVNVAITRLGYHPLDEPPFVWLQGVVTLAALLTTIMVLTTQNRQMRFSEQRAHLDLQ